MNNYIPNLTMRHPAGRLAVFIATAFLFAACTNTHAGEKKKKQVATAKAVAAQDTIVNWKHVYSSGGMMPGRHVATDTLFISFRKGHFYKGRSAESMHDEGPFHLVMGKTIYSATKTRQMLVVDADGYSPVLYTKRNDSLFLTDNHVEPFTNCYVKQR